MKNHALTQQETQAQTKGFWQKYTDDLHTALSQSEATIAGEAMEFEMALDVVRGWLREAESNGRKIMLIGNGGSAATASHRAVDFWKNGKVKALTFNDSAQLTCLANDLSHEDGFAAAIEAFGQEGDLLIGISCSGTSQNIVNGARQALSQGIRVITTTGFKPDNTLRGMGHANFYVPHFSYGIVETLHQLIIHAMLDVKMYCDDQVNIFHRNQPLQ